MERLKTLRKALKKTQADVAIYLGVTVSAYGNYELGQREPDLTTLNKLAEYFGVSVDYLLGRTNNPDIVVHAPNEYLPDGSIAMSVIGNISAGYDGSANEEIIDNIKILPLNLRGYDPEDCFLLRVHGNSMYPDFHDGDIVAVHRQSSVNSGSIAVVLYDGEYATLKKVEYEPGCDWMRLVPRNPEYQEKTIRGIDLNDCRVLGLVLSIVYRSIV